MFNHIGHDANSVTIDVTIIINRWLNAERQIQIYIENKFHYIAGMCTAMVNIFALLSYTIYNFSYLPLKRQHQTNNYSNHKS